MDILSGEYSKVVSPQELFAYAYTVLGCSAYTETFAEELFIPGPRLPITKDPEIFQRGVEVGRWLIGLHTYGARFGGSVPQGKPGSISLASGEGGR